MYCAVCIQLFSVSELNITGTNYRKMIVETLGIAIFLVAGSWKQGQPLCFANAGWALERLIWRKHASGNATQILLKSGIGEIFLVVCIQINGCNCYRTLSTTVTVCQFELTF